MSKIKKYNGIKYYVVISLIAVFGIGMAIYAYSGGTANNVFEGDCVNCNLDTPEIINEPTLGAAPSGEGYDEVSIHNVLISEGAIYEQFTVPATTTKNVILSKDLKDDIAYYTNSTGEDLICDLTKFIVFSSSDSWTYSFGVGTTTWANTSKMSWTNTTTATIIASTTAASTFDYVANGFYQMTNEGNPGSYYSPNGTTGAASSTTFILESGESLVAWIKTITATSSDSLVLNSGHYFTGALQASCNFVGE